MDQKDHEEPENITSLHYSVFSTKLTTLTTPVFVPLCCIRLILIRYAVLLQQSWESFSLSNQLEEQTYKKWKLQPFAFACYYLQQ